MIKLSFLKDIILKNRDSMENFFDKICLSCGYLTSCVYLLHEDYSEYYMDKSRKFKLYKNCDNTYRIEYHHNQKVRFIKIDIFLNFLFLAYYNKIERVLFEYYI